MGFPGQGSVASAVGFGWSPSKLQMSEHAKNG